MNECVSEEVNEINPRIDLPCHQIRDGEHRTYEKELLAQQFHTFEECRDKYGLIDWFMN